MPHLIQAARAAQQRAARAAHAVGPRHPFTRLLLAAAALAAARAWEAGHRVTDIHARRGRHRMIKPTYETHQRRAIEADGTTHAARYAGDRRHVTLACAVYPMPTIERLVHAGDVWTVTCPGCRAALAIVITCPLCKTPAAQEFGLPIPGTDDSADCARCVNPECGLHWGLDPAANGSCTECGGSGHTGRGTIHDPRCACLESQHTH